MFRILIAECKQEVSSFNPVPSGYADFIVSAGDALLASHRGVRSEEQIEWRGQSIRVKRSALPSGGERAKPEFEDVARAAAALGITPLAAYRAMLAEGVAAEEGSKVRSSPA